MDPVSALSLACNVAQIVEQAIEVVQVCKTLYERGSLDENDLIEKYAKDVMRANKELEKPAFCDTCHKAPKHRQRCVSNCRYAED